MYPSRHTLEYMSEMDKLFSRNHEFDLHSPMLSSSSHSFHSIIPSSSSTETSPESYPDITVQRQFQNEGIFDQRPDTRSDIFDRSGSDTFEPKAHTFDSRANAFEPRKDTFDPRTDTFIQRTNTFNPRTNTFNQRTDTFDPRTNTFEKIQEYQRSTFIRSNTPFEREAFDRQADKYQRSPDTFNRTDTFKRQDTPFKREHTPFRSNTPERQHTPFEREHTPFEREHIPFEREHTPFKREHTPFERSNTPFERTNSFERLLNEREPFETPFIIRRQRPIIGRKIMASNELPKIQETNMIWSPIDLQRTPPKSNVYELFPMESRGFEMTPVKSSSYSSSPMTLSPMQVSPSLQSSPKPIAPQMLRTPPRRFQPIQPSSPFSPYEMNQNMPGTSQNYQSKLCTFCKKNGETPLVYMDHYLKEKVDNRSVVSCPILRKHVCTICGATGDDAHTITYCPILRASNNGQPLKSTTNALKNTRVKSNGRRRY